LKNLICCLLNLTEDLTEDLTKELTEDLTEEGKIEGVGERRWRTYKTLK